MLAPFLDPNVEMGSSSARWMAGGAPALWILATIATLFFLRAASQLLIPVVLAVLISYAFEPVVDWLARRRVPRVAGASLILLGLLALGAWGVYALRDDVARTIDALPEAARRAREMVSPDASGPAASIQEAAEELQGAEAASGGERPSAATGTSGAREPAGGRARESSAGGAPREMPGREGARQDGGALQDGLADGAAQLLQRGVGSVFALAGHATVIFFLLFFLLLSGHHFRRRLIELAGPRLERRHLTAAVIDDINAQIQRFLLVRLVTAAIVGAATWGVLAWMGVENAPLWGVLAGVFNSIPYFGPIIVSGGLLVVGLVQGGGMAQAVKMSGAALAITSLEGWLLTPPLMGKAERMSALTVFLGLLLWTWLWGAWGTILAVPMLVVVKAVADRVEPLKPLGRLMAP